MSDLWSGWDPDQISLLTPEEQQKFRDSMAMLVGGESFKDYICRIAPDEPPPEHLYPLVDVIEQSRVQPVRVCIDIGPGHAKTTTLCRGLAWWLGLSPSDLCAYLSYSDSQARSKSAIALDAYATSGDQLRSNRESPGSWYTSFGGGLVSKGAQGGITGKRIPGLLVYDDPYKDLSEARSSAINGKIIDRFKAVAFTRLQGGSIIILHTRWAMDDLIGYILRELKWDSISIPTICNKVDEKTGVDRIGREIGDVAWPDHYPYEICLNEDGSKAMCGHDGHLKEIKLTLGDHIFAAMYQGQPRPEGHALFHEPARFQLYDDPKTGKKSEFSWSGKRGVISIDPAATAATSADWSVILTIATEGFGIWTKMWIVDCVRVQVEIPELVNRIVRVQKERKLWVACEAVAGFKAVPQQLRAIDPKIRVIDVTPNGKSRLSKSLYIGGGDKFTRALGLSAAWNQGRVMIPIDAPWADTLIEEFMRFTGNNDRHDDQVDAATQGWNVLYRGKKPIDQSAYADGGV